MNKHNTIAVTGPYSKATVSKRQNIGAILKASDLFSAAIYPIYNELSQTGRRHVAKPNASIERIIDTNRRQLVIKQGVRRFILQLFWLPTDVTR